jgi:uncharacterized protein
MRTFKVSGVIALVGLIIGLTLTWFVGSALTAATPSAVDALPAPAQDVEFSSEPGIRIHGSYWPQPTPDAPAVLLLHGNGGHRANVAATAQWLHGQGYAALAIDLRGHGRSTPSDKSFGYFEAADAHAALAWLRARYPEARVGVIGFSLGGAAAVLGPDGPVRADALVLMSTYPDMRRAIGNRIMVHAGSVPAAVLEPLLSYQSRLRVGVWPEELSPVNALRRVESPVLIAGGALDPYTTPAELREMQAAAGPGTELWVLDGVGHDDMVSAEGAEWRGRLLAFLDRHLRAQGDPST